MDCLKCGVPLPFFLNRNMAPNTAPLKTFSKHSTSFKKLGGVEGPVREISQVKRRRATECHTKRPPSGSAACSKAAGLGILITHRATPRQPSSTARRTPMTDHDAGPSACARHPAFHGCSDCTFDPRNIISPRSQARERARVREVSPKSRMVTPRQPSPTARLTPMIDHDAGPSACARHPAFHG